jgi:hypothetical protein
MTSSVWLPEQALDVSALGGKQLPQVAARTLAEVSWDADGWLSKFNEHSVCKGKVLKSPGGSYSPSLVPKFVVLCCFRSSRIWLRKA